MIQGVCGNEACNTIGVATGAVVAVLLMLINVVEVRSAELLTAGELLPSVVVTTLLLTNVDKVC